MLAKEILGGKTEEQKESKLPHSGTKRTGYVESSTPKECRTCEYFEGKNLCNNREVALDKQVPRDRKTGLKIVQPVRGCCDHWEEPD